MAEMLIPISRGYCALVDDEWYDRIIGRKWHAVVKANGNVYARSVAYMGVREPPVYTHMHRLIMAPPDSMEVDHIDGNGLNNTTRNLRLATRKQNAQNRSSSRGALFKGVQRIRANCFQAKIGIDGRKVSVGCFKTEIEAAIAYDRAAKQWHGEFARLNFPYENHPSPPPSGRFDSEDPEEGTWTKGISR